MWPTRISSFVSRIESKRVLIREIETKLRPSAGNQILEECFEPAGAAPEEKQAFANNDDELSDTDCLQACAQYQIAHSRTVQPRASIVFECLRSWSYSLLSVEVLHC